jgi:hypothetical protein
MWFISRDTFQNSGGEKFASIITSTKDTRVKRAGSLSWANVSSPVDCFEDDRIFTGKDSTATLEFTSGGKVTLLPNSLISLSKGFINLSSGTIEVDLKKGSIGIESLGEKIQLGKNSKFRLESTATGSQVTALAEDDAEPEKIISMYPEYGAELPKFSGNVVNLSWKSNYPDRSYKIEISPNGIFSVIRVSRTTAQGRITIPASELPPSNVYWRIVDSSGKILSRSSFFLIDDIKVELTAPKEETNYVKAAGSTQEVRFEWVDRFNYPQRFQIARDPSFASPLKDSVVTSSSTTMSFIEEGSYYWRVGYNYGKQQTDWSKPNRFKITREITTSPLQIADLPRLLDFETITTFTARVVDRNGSEEYQFRLTQGEKELLNRIQSTPSFPINYLPDGDYTLTVIGLKKGKHFTTEAARSFVVKTTRKLQAPKIKTKQKMKLFVRLFKNVVDLFLPSAEAAATSAVLEWEAVEGAKTYELEISNADGAVVVKHKTEKLSFVFDIPGPEQYYWRVRSVVDGKVSSFTKYSEIEVTDKVLQMSKALMIFPGDQMKIRAPKAQTQVRFRWRVPSKSFTYVLEVFDLVSVDPVYTQTVTGGSLAVPAEELPAKFQWRVLAKSRYNNENPNPEKFTVELRHFERKSKAFYGSAWGGYLSSTVKHDIKDLTKPNLPVQAKVSGQTAALAGTYFLDPQLAHAVAFELQQLQLKDSLNEFTETRLTVEYGWLGDTLRNVSHNFYAGGRISSGSLSLNQEIDVKYMTAFVSGRYAYVDHLSKSLLFSLHASVYLQAPDIGSPGYQVRPTLSYKATRSYWIEIFALAETMSTKFSSSSLPTKEKVTADQTNVGAGLALTYRFGL